MTLSLFEKHYCLSVIYELVAFWHLFCFTILHDLTSDEAQSRFETKLMNMFFYFVLEVFEAMHNPKFHTCRTPEENENAPLYKCLFGDRSHCAKCTNNCFRCKMMDGKKFDWPGYLLNWLHMLALLWGCMESLFENAKVPVSVRPFRLYILAFGCSMTPFHIFIEPESYRPINRTNMRRIPHNDIFL